MVLKSFIPMTRLILILGFCFAYASSYAQNEGTIVYKSTVQVASMMKGRDLPPDIKKMIPKERSAMKELSFTKEESTYKGMKRDESKDDVDSEQGGRRMRMRFMGGREKDMTYRNLSEQAVIEQRDIMGKTFLIEDDAQKLPWKMTGQKKQILDYMCMEATFMEDDTVKIVAWFTPQIPVSTGPARYAGLPGLILELSIDDGARVISAESVSLIAVEEGKLEKPTKGKKVTREEFEKIRKEKFDEMKEARGGRGGGRFMISRGRG